MSKGFGRVQSALIDIFENIGEETYSLAELCELVYGQAAQKKHRVAVLRAVNDILKRFPWICVERDTYHGSYCFCDGSKLQAYAVMQTRQMTYGACTHEEAVERLQRDRQYYLEHPGQYRDPNKHMEPETGLWWLYCAATKAERDGNKKAAEPLWARYNDAVKKYRAELFQGFRDV
jgi:hypothetical protein